MPDSLRIDLPKLKSIELGKGAFHDSLSTVIEGLCLNFSRNLNRLSFLRNSEAWKILL